jgi:hypothetical protein
VVHAKISPTRELEHAGREPTDASLLAQRRFGSVALAMDRARDVWMPVGLRDVSHDARFAVRLFVKDPGFTVVAVTTLALGCIAQCSASILLNFTFFILSAGLRDAPLSQRAT